jgi:hypothetical protein
MSKVQIPNPKSQIKRSVTWHSIFVIASLCLVAIRPWFKLEPVCSDDFGFHLLRLVQLDSLLRQGVLYSRWAPDMALGYGYPFFNFYAPLSYYVASAFSLMGLGFQPALIASFAAATVAAGLAAYALARNHFSPRSSLVAAVAYAYAPYLGYDAYFRGNLAETLAWAFLPLALWAMERLARWGGRHYLAGTALAYAAVLLTHNVFALIFSPLLAVYGVVTVLTLAPPRLRRRRIIAIVGALLLGLGLSAFFWLPALVERAYVHSDRLLVPPIFVYWNNFIELRELFAVPRTIHPDLLNPSPARALGLIPVLLGLPALVGLWRFKNRGQRVQVSFFAVASVTYAWLTTASSRIIWDNVPLVEYVQFPWRLLGPAALCLAVLIAAAAELLPANRGGSLLAAGAMALLVGGALFWLDPRYCPGMEAPTVASIADFERATNTIGTTAKGEYLPRTVETFPKEAATTALAPSSLPPSTTVAQQNTHPIGAELVITASQPFTAIYNGFDYPGWRVTVDGDSVPITPDEPYGRITFPVPKGRHTVSIRFGETGLRRASDYLSLACLASTIALMSKVQIPNPKSQIKRSATWHSISVIASLCPSQGELEKDELLPSPYSLLPTPPLLPSWTWAGWGLVLLGAVTLLQHVQTPLRQPGLQDGTLPNLDVVTNVPFEGGLTLLGFNQEQTTLPSGDRLRLDLFWTAHEPPPDRYQRAIALLGPDGLRWNPKDTLPPRDFREPSATWAWPVGTYVQDSHYVETGPGTPPGTYDLSLALFERETLAPMRVLEASGQPGLPMLSLGQVTVTRPRRSPDPAEVTMQHHLNADLGPLTLLGISLDRTEAAPGDPFLITLFWLAAQDPKDDLTTHLVLVATDGSPVATFDLPPTTASHPTSTWQAGDLWRGQHALHFPASLEDGDYTWRLTLLPVDQSIHLPSTVHITAPPHAFTPPPVDVEIEAHLGDVTTLLGATLEPGTRNLEPGTPLTVTLVWRAETETHTSYHVFLHLLAPDGTLVAQSDGIPADWARPTTGWLPGEYITDVRVLTLPKTDAHDGSSGPYSLRAGLYESSGIRLTRPDGSDSTLLTIITMRKP